MKFAVKKGWSNEKARVGVIQLQLKELINKSKEIMLLEEEIETPALLISTRKGLPSFISPDLLSLLPSRLLQSSPLHFLEGLSPKTVSSIGGMHQMLGLHDYGFAAVPRDSIVCIPECKGANKNGASFETPCGRITIKPAEYMELISSMKPNLWATLADEVPAWVSEKRNKASVDRTLRWLDECIALSSVNTLQTGDEDSSRRTSISEGIFGAIVGGSSVEERRRCTEEVSKRNVSGYWIGGFGLGESIEERSDLLKAVTDNLPEEKPRQISGLGLPEEVLQGIAAGIDLFDSSYIYHLTIGGFALTFPLDGVEINKPNFDPSATGSDQMKINLKATVYRKDTSPVVDGCSCYTCQNHTKAYINHLLNVHEMLAQILLEIHNTHHYLGFFCTIREAIKGGKFEQFRQKFIENRRNFIFETSPVA